MGILRNKSKIVKDNCLKHFEGSTEQENSPKVPIEVAIVNKSAPGEAKEVKSEIEETTEEITQDEVPRKHSKGKKPKEEKKPQEQRCCNCHVLLWMKEQGQNMKRGKKEKAKGTEADLIEEQEGGRKHRCCYNKKCPCFQAGKECTNCIACTKGCCGNVFTPFSLFDDILPVLSRKTEDGVNPTSSLELGPSTRLRKRRRNITSNDKVQEKKQKDSKRSQRPKVFSFSFSLSLSRLDSTL